MPGDLAGGKNIEMFTQPGDTLRLKLAEFMSVRDSGDVEQKSRAANELAEAFIKAVRTFQQVMAATGPVRVEDPDSGAFVYAIANVVNSNLRPALRSLGSMAMPIFFDMLSARSNDRKVAERVEGSAQRVQAYVQAFAGGAVDAATINAIARISQDFQHPLEFPGMDGKAGSLKGNSSRALFLSMLRFNLDKFESELREEGILTDETPSEMKTHFTRIAMQFFADRVGGIANAVQKLSDSDYARLYDEAYAQEVNSPKLLVRDALVHFRFPIQG